MKNRTKILSLFLTVAILITSMVFVFPTTAEEAAEPPVEAEGLWSQYVANSFAGGIRYGTEGWGGKDKPYEISTAEELAYLAYLVNRGDKYTMEGKYFSLTADIDLSAHHWVPIGKTFSGSNAYDYDGDGTKDTFQMTFSGVFDGGGHTITGLTFDDEMYGADGKMDATYGGVALFGRLQGKKDSVGKPIVTATVKNFNLVGSAKFTNYQFVTSQFGGPVSMVATAAYAASLIENVNVTANIEITSGVANANFAGLVGYATNGAAIKGCTMSGEITVDTTASAKDICVGGFVSRIGNGALIENCVNYANITARTKARSAIAGGIAAKTEASANATFAEDDETKSLQVGMENVASIVNCINYGDITIDNQGSGNNLNSYAGGMIGVAGTNFIGDAIIVNCMNTGEVEVSALGLAGGVAAMVGLQKTTRVAIRNSYSTTVPVSKNEADSYTAAFICNAGGGRITNDIPMNKRTYYTPADCVFMSSDVVENINGAALRINPTKAERASLRFDSKINEQFLKVMEGKKITYGTYVIEAEELNKYADGTLSVSEMISKIPADKMRSVTVSDMTRTGGFSAILTNLKEDLHEVEFVAISFVEVVLDEETDYAVMFYSDYHAKTDEQTRSVSVKSIAKTYYNLRQDAPDGVYAYKIGAEYNPELGEYSMFSEEQLAMIKYYMLAGELPEEPKDEDNTDDEMEEIEEAPEQVEEQ